MDLTESIFSWGFVFAVLSVVFRILDRRRNNVSPPPKSGLILLRTISIALAFAIHVILSLLLYEPVMELFNISKHGFINVNGLATFAAIWSIIALSLFVAMLKTKALLGVYYKPLRAACLVFFALPFAIVLFFLLFADFK